MLYIYPWLRALWILLVQVLILQYIPLGLVHVYLYPLVVMLLPIAWLPAVVIFVAFLYGWSIDVFYNTDGLHALSLLLVASTRPLIFALLEPRGGYEASDTPSRANFGLAWFSRYAGVFLLLHSFLVVLLEELAWSYIILGRFFFTYLLSLGLVLLVQLIINPR